MTGIISKQHDDKKALILMPRDFYLLEQLNLHRTISASQLAKICFSQSTYETARKRIRKIMQAGLIAGMPYSRTSGRGRPELCYFLANQGAEALAKHKNIALSQIATGPPHAYHKEHLLRLCDLRVALKTAEQRRLIFDLSWQAGDIFCKHLPDFAPKEKADAAISFRYATGKTLLVLLTMDTGNLRQTRHWEPRLTSLLDSGYPVWTIVENYSRLARLAKWSEPLLAAAKAGPDRLIFALFGEITEKGLFAARWWRTDGGITNIKPP